MEHARSRNQGRRGFSWANRKFYRRVTAGRLRRHLSKRVACEMVLQEELGRHYSDEKELTRETRALSFLRFFSFLSLVWWSSFSDSSHCEHHLHKGYSSTALWHNGTWILEVTKPEKCNFSYRGSSLGSAEAPTLLKRLCLSQNELCHLLAVWPWAND